MADINNVLNSLKNRIADLSLEIAVISAELEEANEKIQAFENQPEPAKTTN